MTEEAVMDTEHKTSIRVQAINRRPSVAQRRAAEAASLLGKQARLKQEAADRRAQRENRTDPAASRPRHAAGGTRSNSL